MTGVARDRGKGWWAAHCLLVVVGYLGLTLLGTSVELAPGGMTPVWPASGLALAALLILGNAVWPGVFLGAFAGSLVVMAMRGAGPSVGALSSVVLALTATLHVLLSAGLMRRFAGGRRAFEKPRTIAVFIGLEAVVSLLAAVVDTGFMAATGFGPSGARLSGLSASWTSDLMGVLLVTPVFLAPREGGRPRWLAGLVLALCTWMLGQVVFDVPLPLGHDVRGPVLFFFVPLVVVAGFVVRARAVAWVVLGIAILCLWGTSAGKGPIAASAVPALIMIDLYLGSLSITGLILSAVVRQRDHAEVALRADQQLLEARVAQRTIELRQANQTLQDEIGERRRTERQLAQTRAWVAVAFDNLPFDVFVVDAEGRYAYQNRTSIAHWGDQRGKRPSETGLPSALLSAWESNNRRALAGEVVTTTATYGRGPDLRVVEKILAPIRVDAAVEGLVGFNIDITEKHRLREQVALAQRMESVGRLAGGVAHDFNNLLTAIRGHLALLLERHRTDESTLESLQIIDQASQRAADLTAQLLAFAGKRPMVARNIDVKAALQAQLRLIGPMLGENVRVSIDAPDALSPVHMDPAHLDQVLVNLAMNARDAMPAGGEVRLVVREVPRASEEARREELGADTVRIDVIDSGTGMSEQVLERVFEPFFSTKDTGKGTGLGLSVCYGLVSRAGGRIRVASALGRGTTVSVYLPVVGGAAAAPAVVSAPSERGAVGGAPTAGHGPATILFVEDEPLVRALATRVLERAGYRVVAAADGQEAMDIVRRDRPPIALVVTDLVMPGMSGRAVIEGVRALYPGLPALMISGHSEDVVHRTRGSVRQGAADDEPLLHKPFLPHQLVQAVTDAFARGAKQPGRQE